VHSRPIDPETLISTLKKACPRLAGKHHFAYLLVFGSYAHGEVWPQSDIDIAVRMPEGNDWLEASLSLAGDIERLLETWQPVNVVVLNVAPPALKYEIYARGLLLFCADEILFENDYLQALHEYFDFQYVAAKDYEEAKRYLNLGEP